MQGRGERGEGRGERGEGRGERGEGRGERREGRVERGEERGERREKRGERGEGRERILGQGSPTTGATELLGELVKNLSTVGSEAISCKVQFYR